MEVEDQVTFGYVVLMGLIAGFTIFIGLPVARLRGLSRTVQGVFNAIAIGILIFLLWDVLSKAKEPVEKALTAHQMSAFAALAAIFAGGMGVGLMSLVYGNSRLKGWLAQMEGVELRGPGAAVIAEAPAVPAGRLLAITIALGLGMHNFSEGLAIGQSAVSGEISFALVLVIGFALHNVTEGFGVAAPLASDAALPSWSFLGLAGLIAGGPTVAGTLIGYSFRSEYVSVLFLTLAAGALIYVINEMCHVGRRMNSPIALGWGILAGFLAGLGTDLVLTFAGV